MGPGKEHELRDIKMLPHRMSIFKENPVMLWALMKQNQDAWMQHLEENAPEIITPDKGTKTKEAAKNVPNKKKRARSNAKKPPTRRRKKNKEKNMVYYK